MTRFRKIPLLVGATLLSLAAGAQAEEGNWLLRVRATHLDWRNSSDPITALGLPADSVKVDDRTIPEVDISYFFTPNVAAELVLTYPQKFDVSVDGVGEFGDFKALPPTLLAQYHFNPEGKIRPYVGAGVNYTLISSVDLALGADLENDSIGLAFQVGADIRVADGMFLNVDLKKIQINSDVSLGGTRLTHLKLDPLAVSVGLGWRF